MNLLAMQQQQQQQQRSSEDEADRNVDDGGQVEVEQHALPQARGQGPEQGRGKGRAATGARLRARGKGHAAKGAGQRARGTGRAAFDLWRGSGERMAKELDALAAAYATARGHAREGRCASLSAQG